ncbi:cyclopropane-fatty-acyl-phospholipid synthase [Nemania sp. FL0031]|nr:cyclopropane-fatty-acyl-phospholipid synthase [Nemania sp. FL0031]
MAITTFIGTRLRGIRQYAGSMAWGPALRASKPYILALFRKIEIGQLTIVDGKYKTICGRATSNSSELRAELVVHKEAFWVRMLLFADMGFADSYMLGEVACTDLASFFEIFIRNRSQLSNGTTLLSSISSALSSFARATNNAANSRLNVAAHYDLSNEMFAAFLSSDMTYSCAIWHPKSDLNSSAGSLEDAQKNKLKYVIDAAHIKSTDHVLEIGTGWGSFAIMTVSITGCRVTTITLSVEPEDGVYDKIVSLAMIEAVGNEHLKTYFECIDRLLKPDGGIAVFECTTIPETRYENYHRSTDFIREYIFPGGHLPSVSLLFSSIYAGSQGRLVPSTLLNVGGHYGRTVREWGKSFLQNFDEQIKPALLKEHDNMTERDVEIFKRKWEYYFTYCEAGFRTATLGTAFITVGREGCGELNKGVTLIKS